MNLLVIDDDPNVRSSMVKFLGLKGHRADGAESAEAAKKLLNRTAYDAMLLDLRMPGMDGLEFLEWLAAESFQIPVIMISAHGEIPDAVRALKLGARDYLTKPFDPEELQLRIERIEDEQKLRRLQEGDSTRRPSATCYWGQSKAMLQLRTELGRAAATDATILLSGESGTGKEVTARWIHANSQRGDQAFVAVNLGGLPESLAESELFGHEKGAFTGADSLRRGIFESAQGGTVFLDEVGELPLRMQPALLRVLQESMVKRIGNPREFPVDVRIIAATNQNLEERVRAGSFREDLYYRLSVIPFVIPPLRERLGDLPGLVESLLQRIARRIGSKSISVDPQVFARLHEYSFPGNIRELENLLERWAILSEDRRIRAEDIERSIQPHRIVAQRSNAGGSLKAAELQTIRYWLGVHEGNRTRAAKDLGISRKTLISKIAEYGIE